MLIQIHHQLIADRSKTDVLAQKEINNDKEMREFHQEVRKSRPLSSGEYCYLVCTEESEFFNWAIEDWVPLENERQEGFKSKLDPVEVKGPKPNLNRRHERNRL